MRQLGYFFAIAVLGTSTSLTARAQDAAPQGDGKTDDTKEAAPAETQPAFEEVNAAPAGATAETQVTASAQVKEDDAAAKKPFSLSVTMEHAIGTGNFVRNAQVREVSEYFGQSWQISPSYGFDAFGHRLSASARIGFEQEFTQPDTNPARNFKPSDTRLSLNDGKLYTWELTGIEFNGGVRVTLPTSYESINVRKLRLGTGMLLGAARSFGPVDLSYTFGLSKNFHGSPIITATSEVARGGEGDQRPGGLNDPTQFQRGPANTSWSLSNTVGVSWNISETLSLGYSLAITNGFRYDMPDDALRSLNADPEGYTNQLAPSLELGYDATALVKQYADVPFTVGLAAGISASHGFHGRESMIIADGEQFQVADRGKQEILWPVFFPVFANNRAASNYGSIYFDISARY